MLPRSHQPTTMSTVPASVGVPVADSAPLLPDSHEGQDRSAAAMWG